MGLSSALAAQAAGQPPTQQQATPPQQQGWLAAPPAYGGGAPAAAASTYPPQQPQLQPNAGMASVVAAKLHKIVQARQLQAFYPADRLQAVVARVTATVDFHALAARWRMPVELAVDLSSLALYDCVLYADDSGSMESEDGERIEDLKLIVSKVAEVATLFDDDGIEVRFINSNVQGNHIKTAHDASRLVAGLEYRWDTKIGTQLEAKVLTPLVYNRRLAKPLLVVTVTDGEPSESPQDKVAKVIRECVKSVEKQGLGPHAVAFQFAQVGRDQGAQRFLASLDNHPKVGGLIDCTSYFELEQAEYAAKGIHLSVEAWLVKLLIGAIDQCLDAADEAHPTVAAAGHTKKRGLLEKLFS